MANLTNSQRSTLKATYVPTKSSNGIPASTSRVVEKVAMIRQLNLQPAELDNLAQNKAVQGLNIDLSKAPNNPFQKKTIQLLDVVRKLATNVSSLATTTYAPLLQYVSPEQLNIFGQAVASERQNIADVANNHIQQITGAFKKAFPKAIPNQMAIMNWAAKKADPSLLKLQNLMTTHLQTLTPQQIAAPAAAIAFTDNAASAASSSLDVVNGFLDRFKVEPVGRLHLERIEMTPVGIEHGELVHSVPLTPQETVNISHREWSTTTQTFENIVSDSFTGFSEEGVAEKTDIAQATTNESRQQSSLDVNGNVSASYSGSGFSVTASTGIDYNTHSDDFKSVKDSLAHSVAVTRTASARTRKDHRTSFRVSSVAGTEDLAVQVLTNPTNNAIRVDYYQLMRKWKVNLIRYGLRMTYDIVLPNPGNALAFKLGQLFVLKLTAAADHVFAVKLSDITVTNWADYEQQFGVSIDPPPSDPFETMQTGTLENSANKYLSVPVQLQIPEGYEVTGGEFWARLQWVGNAMQLEVAGEAHDPGSTPIDGGGQFVDNNGNPTSDAVVGVTLTTNSIVGRTGTVAILISHFNVGTGGWILKVQASPTTETLATWRAKVWGQLRDADQASYQAGVNKINDNIAQLQKELAEFDALTLRRMEREEIMKGLLQWLFGPSFQLQPGALDQFLTDPEASVFQANNNDAWQTVLQ
ncbi:MAG TPA: hypothetical protein VK671_00725, partial [Mucilaginibacter sp.]|nr:hypothetical protein [Mucilaginibacter sp.]